MVVSENVFSLLSEPKEIKTRFHEQVFIFCWKRVFAEVRTNPKYLNSRKWVDQASSVAQSSDTGNTWFGSCSEPKDGPGIKCSYNLIRNQGDWPDSLANMIAEYVSLIAAIMRGYRYISAQKDVSTCLICEYRRMGHDWHVCQFWVLKNSIHSVPRFWRTKAFLWYVLAACFTKASTKGHIFLYFQLQPSADPR